MRPLLFPGTCRSSTNRCPRFLDDAAAAKLLRATRADPDPLSRLIVELLARTGIRRGELLALTADAVVQIGSAYWLRIPIGKLHNDRYIPLHPRLKQLLDDWIIHHRPTGLRTSKTRSRWMHLPVMTPRLWTPSWWKRTDCLPQAMILGAVMALRLTQRAGLVLPYPDDSQKNDHRRSQDPRPPRTTNEIPKQEDNCGARLTTTEILGAFCPDRPKPGDYLDNGVSGGFHQ